VLIYENIDMGLHAEKRASSCTGGREDYRDEEDLKGG
jgi:hypothetical protein